MQATPIDTSLADGARILELWRSAGWTMWPLALCALIATAIVVWKLADLSVHTSRTVGLLERVDSLLGRGMIAEALAAARESDSVAGRVLIAGLTRRAAGGDRVARSIANAGAIEYVALERGLVPLATIAAVAPLLGLLGTVVVLLDIARAETGVALASAAGPSIVPAATGALIAIAAAVLHNFLAGRVRRLRERIGRSGDNVVAAIRALESGAAPEVR